MLNIETAQKDHVCDICKRKIPAGHRYWRDYEENEVIGITKDFKEHTNCELYQYGGSSNAE